MCNAGQRVSLTITGPGTSFCYYVGSSKSQFSKPNSVTKTGISSHILPNVVITYIDIDKNIVFPSYSMKE